MLQTMHLDLSDMAGLMSAGSITSNRMAQEHGGGQKVYTFPGACYYLVTAFYYLVILCTILLPSSYLDTGQRQP